LELRVVPAEPVAVEALGLLRQAFAGSIHIVKLLLTWPLGLSARQKNRAAPGNLTGNLVHAAARIRILPVARSSAALYGGPHAVDVIGALLNQATHYANALVERLLHARHLILQKLVPGFGAG